MPLLLFFVPLGFTVVSVIYLSVCYCYDVVVGHDSKDRCYKCFCAVHIFTILSCQLLSLGPLFIICFCCCCRRNGPCSSDDLYLPRVCPCCFKGQFACYWPCCRDQDYITVDCPCFCCCSDPFIRPQTETPVVTNQPGSTADIFTVTPQSDPQPQNNTDVLSQAASGGSTTVTVEEEEEDVRPVAMDGEKVRWAFPRRALPRPANASE